MIRSARILATCAALFFILVAESIAAGVPNLLTYQGRMTDSTGANVPDNHYMIRFQIYDDSLAGTVMWSSGTREILITDGLFSYRLGDSVAIPESLFINDSALWLGIKIGIDTELIPRTRLTSNAYAHHSLRSDSSEISATVFDNSITGAKIVDGTITGADIQDGTITSADIADGQISGADIANNTITGANVQDGTISSSDLAAGAVTNTELADNSVSTGKISDGTITSNDIAAGTIGNAQLGPSSVNSFNIVDNSIATADLAANAVTNSKLANNSVSSVNIIDGSVSSTDIAVNSIGTVHLVNGSIAVVDLSAAAIPSAGWSEIATTIINSTTPVTMDSFTVITPGPGALVVQLSGHFYIDADATSSASLTTYAQLGICDSLNSDGTCDGTYDAFFFQDADDVATQNVSQYINLTRLVFVGGAGPRTFYVNAETSSVAFNFWSYQAPKVLAMFFPSSMSVTSSPAVPGTVNDPQQK